MKYKLLLLGAVLLPALLAGQTGLAAKPATIAREDGAPAVTVKAGSFQKKTTLGAQTVAGVGFRPRLLVLFGVARTENGFGGGYQYGFGASDGAESRAIAGWSWDDRTVGSDTDRRLAPKAITFVTTIAQTVAEADLVSFDSDGFTLNWTTNNNKAWIIDYLAVGGDNVECKVSQFNADNASTGNKSYAHVGFRPDLLLLFGAPSIFGPLEASFGFADSAGSQFAMSVASRNTGTDPTNTVRYQRTDKVFVALDPVATDLESEASFVSMGPAGFTLDWTTAAASAQTLVSVAIRGVNAKVGAISEEMYPGDQAYTGAGFRPRGALFAGFNREASAAVEDHNRFTIGVAGEEGSEASIWLSDTDNSSGITRTDQALHSDRCYVGANTGPFLTAETLADLKSWDADGFTLTWTGYPQARSQIGYLLLGDPLRAVGGFADPPFTSTEAPTVKKGPWAREALAGLTVASLLLLAAGGWRGTRQSPRR